MRIQLIAFLSVSIIVCAGGAKAQEAAQKPPRPPMPQLLPGPDLPPPMPDNPFLIISRYFRFTPQQAEDFAKLLAMRKNATEPALEKIVAAEKRLRDLVAAETDPATVGNAVIALEALRRQVQEINHQFIVDLRQLLTPEQKAQLEMLEHVLRIQAVANAARALGVL